jgi:CheY-specific phosphatase CheX
MTLQGEQMKAQHINIFLESFYRVLSNLADLAGTKKKVTRIEGNYPFSGIVTGFKVKGPVFGEVYFIMNTKTALSIASRAFFGLNLENFEGIAKDAIGELGCRIAADTLKDFKKNALECTVSSPFVSYKGGNFDFSNKNALGVTVNTKSGEVFLIASLMENTD